MECAAAGYGVAPLVVPRFLCLKEVMEVSSNKNYATVHTHRPLEVLVVRTAGLLAAQWTAPGIGS